MTLQKDDPQIEEYELYFSSSSIPREKWINLIAVFKQLLKKNLKKNFVELLYPEEPDIVVHDINTVIVVEKLTDEIREKESELARKAESSLGLGYILSTLTLQKGDPQIEEYRGVFYG